MKRARLEVGTGAEGEQRCIGAARGCRGFAPGRLDIHLLEPDQATGKPDDSDDSDAGRDQSPPQHLAAPRFGLGLGDARIDEAGFRLVQRMGMIDQPLLRAREQQPLQKGCGLVFAFGLLPVGERPVELHAADQEIALLVEPGPETRPFAQERLMRRLDRAAAGLVGEDDQTGGGELFENRQRRLRQFVDEGRTARILPLLVDLHHAADKGLAQGGLRLAAERGIGKHLVGAPAHRILQRVEMGGRVAERGVLDQGELPVAAVSAFADGAVVEFAQGKGEERQGVVGAGVAGHRRDQRILHLEADDMGRPFDDLAEPRQLHRPEGEFLETDDAFGSALEDAEEIGARRQQRDEHGAVVAGGAEQAQEGLPVFRRRDGEELLELVDGDEDMRLARACCGLQRLGEVGQSGGAAFGGEALAPASPVLGPADRFRGGAGELADRVEPRPERRQDDPVALVAGKPRQHASAHQRRLAGAGGAEQGDHVGGAAHPARAQPLDQPADVVIAAEIDRGILGLEGEEPGIGGTLPVPGEAALGIQRQLDQFGPELRQPALAVLPEIELLDVGRDEALAAGRDDDREDRLAERARLGEFGEAPFAVEPRRREHQDDGLGAVDLLVERALPVHPRLDAGLLVDVEERLVEAVLSQPRHDVGCDGVVLARMRDEDSRHRVSRKRTGVDDRTSPAAVQNGLTGTRQLTWTLPAAARLVRIGRSVSGGRMR